MEQSTPVSTVSSELAAGQLPSNEGLRNIQQVLNKYTCIYCLLTGSTEPPALGLLFISTVYQISVNSVTYLLMCDVWSNISNTRDSVSLRYPNTEKQSIFDEL